MNTEDRNNNTLDLDLMSTIEILRCFNREDSKIPFIIEKELESISKAIDVITKNLQKGGRLIYIGAGTSGRLGVLDASECPPTFGVDNNVVVGIIAGGDRALREAMEGSEDDRVKVIDDLKSIKLSDKDFVLGIAASGRTPYVISGLEYAKSKGCHTGSISCVDNSLVSKIAEYPIDIVTGAEVITGSTRLKAGTAQKLVLNMISSTVMIKLGKVYSNLMVDVQATNQKLVNRSISIINECCDCGLDKAKELFEASKHSTKIGIIMGLANCSFDEAIAQLNNNQNNIAKTIRCLI